MNLCPDTKLINKPEQKRSKESYKILIPTSLYNDPKPCQLYGKIHSETRIINVTRYDCSIDSADGFLHLGEIVADDNYTTIPRKGVIGIISKGELFFTKDGLPCLIECYDLIQNVFSRNSGLLETSYMLNKKAIIIGCGSVGSYICLELAKSGIGHFMIIDFDTVDYQNICRHQCGISDVGEYKVVAVAQRILDINPHAEVILEKTNLESVPSDDFNNFITKESIIISCADSRYPDVLANRIASGYGIPFISIGFWERAFAGEIFYWLPKMKMPCYSCALGTGPNNISGRVNQNNHHVYSTQTDAEQIRIEPGLSVDIEFVTNVGIKLCLDILNRDNIEYIPRLFGHLTQYTLICNTCDPRIGGEMAEIFSYPLQVTTSLMTNFSNDCKNNCQCRWEE